ncbi:tryptophan 2,3-dioxygenase [Saccharopolyspora antimicrobica]|uniref:Tryptophan 2,3-dioxygenase n=1 Tax=Saccharopolyspora antimicrobica TaxID=455193 RepID=A0A1I5C5W8_9PSEU|nr:tryptophan 2,3-dioxygenase family protein [Saccharopolyspora antimicrobica]RKT88970.1 tryptophan 2,3-dioxygenase [Saccharopolyspora antimicrobica]SFN82021.1 tryptophan 2,3-dioxygenase [Saccharopolyspora antimicrobica]
MVCPADTTHSPAYGDFLRLDELLAIACVRDEADRTLFFAAHQACEIWFAVVIRHLESARAAMERGDGTEAAENLERLPNIMQVITQHFDVLSTLTSQSFDEIRGTLGTSSGFQSAQYREIEFLCGARDPRFLNISGLNPGERARLADRFEQKSLSSAFAEYRDARAAAGSPGAATSVERLHDALAAFDDSVRSWRVQHARLAEQFLGAAQGTAGSSGAAYLWRSTERSLFPEIFPQPRSGEPAARSANALS